MLQTDPADKPIVLVVDDNADNLSLMSLLLKNLYNVRVANSGERALRLAAMGRRPDLVLLDIMMPVMDGYEILRQLKAQPGLCDIPVIFLTAKTEMEDEQRGFALGAVDYISKPISPPLVLARVKTHLELKASADFLRNQKCFLEQEVSRRVAEIAAVQDATILVMAALAETRDNDTGNHIRRTQHYVRALAERLRTHPRFAHYLSTTTIDVLFKSAPLHDIGKVGIPDRILLKPGRFEPAEFEIMKTHTLLGRDAIGQVQAVLGANVEFLCVARQIALSHHEKWDGSGYPEGLSGDDIPIAARLMAVADVYDALISRRVYKAAETHAHAAAIIQDGMATHFDPDVVEAFLDLESEFQHIAMRYADQGATPLPDPALPLERKDSCFNSIAANTHEG